VPLVVDVDYAAASAPLRRRTRNIGVGGLFVSTPAPLPEGTPVRLRFTLPGHHAPMAVEAAVAWAEPLLGMGLRFLGLAPGEEAAIRRYVLGQLEAGAPEAAVTSAIGRTLYLAAASDTVRRRIETLLAAEQVPFSTSYPDLVVVPLGGGALPRLRAVVRAHLSAPDQEKCKAVVLVGPDRPTLRDLVTMPSLGELMAAVEGETLAELLRMERVVSHFQPIVPTARPAEVFGYEALVRGQDADGTLVPPLVLYTVGRTSGLLFALDRAARLSAVRSAAAHGITGRLFINVSPASIGDADAHLEVTCRALAETDLTPEQTVFEIVESDRIDDVPKLLSLLDSYRAAGFGVALDDLGAGYSSLSLLAQVRPDYVKLDMGLVRNIHADPYRAEIVARLLDTARALGIRTVAEGVEQTAEWGWFRDHGADLVQGDLFARPALEPPLPRVPAEPGTTTGQP
jgi:uncharacterized protein (TIGR02266 family)